MKLRYLDILAAGLGGVAFGLSWVLTYLIVAIIVDVIWD